MSRTLQQPIVYCISEGRVDEENFIGASRGIVARIAAARRCGVTMFQVREKQLSAKLCFALATEAVQAAHRSGVKLLVNGRADIALAAGADGVHLPADGVPAAAVRSFVPSGFIIGVSTHSMREALAARDDGADFVTFGPVFESPGKGKGLGVEALAEVCEKLHGFPIVALGGVDADSVEALLSRGASGVAAIRYLNECLEAGRPVVV